MVIAVVDIITSMLMLCSYMLRRHLDDVRVYVVYIIVKCKTCPGSEQLN